MTTPRLALSVRPALEMGALQAVAEVQDPSVEVAGPADAEVRLRIFEGAVDLSLCFPDRDALRRFARRVGALGLRRR